MRVMPFWIGIALDKSKNSFLIATCSKTQTECLKNTRERSKGRPYICIDITMPAKLSIVHLRNWMESNGITPEDSGRLTTHSAVDLLKAVVASITPEDSGRLTTQLALAVLNFLEEARSECITK